MQNSYDVAIDFDGVIHDNSSGGYGKPTGQPMTGAIHALATMAEAGLSLCIHSARAVDEASVRAIKEWLRAYGAPHGIDVPYGPKPMATIYLDDRAVTFDSWSQALPDLADRLGFDPGEAP